MPQALSLIDKVLNERYEILRLLSSGTHNDYLAKDRKFSKEVLVKTPSVLTGDSKNLHLVRGKSNRKICCRIWPQKCTWEKE